MPENELQGIYIGLWILGIVVLSPLVVWVVIWFRRHYWNLYGGSCPGCLRFGTMEEMERTPKGREIEVRYMCRKCGAEYKKSFDDPHVEY